MTESSLDAETIKRTQDALGKYVKKPPLTEKLLKKPPFKFIHDVIKVVSVEKGFIDALSIQPKMFYFFVIFVVSNENR